MKAEIRAKATSPGGWGQVGNAAAGPRYAKPVPAQSHGKGRRRCHCGCEGWSTHVGFANGVALTSGCELFVRRWVVSPAGAHRAILPPEPIVCACGQKLRTERGRAAHEAGWRHTRWIERAVAAEIDAIVIPEAPR